MKLRVLLILVVLVVAVGCQPKPEGIKDAVVVVGSSSRYDAVWRFVDEEAGVACWTKRDSRAGISCLPLSETSLDY